MDSERYDCIHAVVSRRKRGFLEVPIKIGNGAFAVLGGKC
jgi:hypothetical protein